MKNAPTAIKIGRNNPCPCGSGKKLKQCCASLAAQPANSMRSTVPHLIAQARRHAFQQGNFAAAEACYRDVLQQEPHNAEALAGVGQGLFWRCRRAEARIYMQKAAKVLLRHANQYEARVLHELSQQLQQWGDIHLALQLAQAACQRQPHYAPARYSEVVCLHRLNLLDPAIEAMQALLQLLPEDSGCQILMALLELDKKQLPLAQARLEGVLARETGPVQHARAALELSKVYDQQQRYAEAFALMTKAGELHRQLPEAGRVNAALLFEKVACYKAGFSADLLQRWQVGDFNDDLPTPVFLVGFLRSGTTLTEQILSAHPQVITSDENSLLDETIRELELITRIYGNVPSALRQLTLTQGLQLRQFYWQRVCEEYGADSLSACFVNKVALNSIEVGLISCLFPEAKILFALRDPRDVCLSCASQSFTFTPATINLLSWDGIARQYAAVMDLWLHLRAHIAPRYLELRYEDSVTAFTETFQRVFALLDLPWYPAVQRFHENQTGKVISTPSFNAVAQPLYQSAVARWHGYAELLQPILPILQPFVVTFGYARPPQSPVE